MAKPPWVYGRGLDTFLARRAFNCSKGRRMHNAWTKEAPEHLTCCSTSSFTATKSSIVLLFLQYASWSEALLGGGPFIMLRSRGISQIYNTYSEDICTPYILLVGVVYLIHTRYWEPMDTMDAAN